MTATDISPLSQRLADARARHLTLSSLPPELIPADADAAYVCRGRLCDLPVTRATELAAALGVSGL